MTLRSWVAPRVPYIASFIVPRGAGSARIRALARAASSVELARPAVGVLGTMQPQRVPGRGAGRRLRSLRASPTEADRPSQARCAADTGCFRPLLGLDRRGSARVPAGPLAPLRLARDRRLRAGARADAERTGSRPRRAAAPIPPLAGRRHAVDPIARGRGLARFAPVRAWSAFARRPAVRANRSTPEVSRFGGRWRRARAAPPAAGADGE
jgi:hypothetical protein